MGQLTIDTSYSLLCDKLSVVSGNVFCIRRYKAGRTLNNFKLSCNLFGMIVVVYNTTGNIQAVFNCHILASFPSVSSRCCAVKVLTVVNCYIY
jgi:hypothetical protein